MTRLLVLLILFPFVPAAYAEDGNIFSGEDDSIEICRAISYLARETMTARQADRPLSETLPAAQDQLIKLLKELIQYEEYDSAEFDEFIREDSAELSTLKRVVATMVIGAYEAPAFTLEDHQQSAISEFENAAFAECYLGMSNSEYAPENEGRFVADSSPEMAAYQFAIAQRISRNWSVPASASSDTSCVVSVRQIPGGEIVGVNILSCNGDEAVKRSVEAAIHRSSPLPEPSNPDLFRPLLELNLRPE